MVAQASSSLSDLGPKWQVPSQNIPRVASKRDVNGTKLNLHHHCRSALKFEYSRSKRIEIEVRSTQIILADTQDPTSIYEMCKRTKLLLNCVGPYNLFGGEMVVSTCVECKTHCIDISAEIKVKYHINILHAQVLKSKTSS
ncbi:hypothetical protein AVEN_271000-1 [Araneus ventricosus]|uniref:Uncharacterized protein n=1 Tax=Araneus ventricosus TaxID=182803 RepID=A0A4Y2CR47_ARAVE|nr:hypothetical protein AVEN_271000-1 [Araneus ventricosus]